MKINKNIKKRLKDMEINKNIKGLKDIKINKNIKGLKTWKYIIIKRMETNNNI